MRRSRSAGRAAGPRRAPAGPPSARRPLPGSKAPARERTATLGGKRAPLPRNRRAAPRGAAPSFEVRGAHVRAGRRALPARGHGRGQAHP